MGKPRVFVVSQTKNKNMLKKKKIYNDKGMAEGHRSQLKELPVAKAGTI